MEHRTWNTIDKSGWPEGPWHSEPDKEQWQDPETGMPCLLVRNRMGALCGYVGVDEAHPWHKKAYNECLNPDCNHEDYCGYENAPEGKVGVHGGLTYSDICMEGPEAETICHVPGPGEPDPVWWFGFDTAHAGDLCPRDLADERLRHLAHGTYRTCEYVKKECADLAKQLTRVAQSGFC